MKLLYTISILIYCGPLMAQTESSAVEKVAKEFLRAADDQNAEVLQNTMHEKAMQYVLFGPNLLTSNRAEYVQQIKDKKLGGQPRSIEIHDVILSNHDIATIRLTATSHVVRFHYQITLVKFEGLWKITAINAKAERV